ncbi:TonB-dependent receptor [Flagellimonas sp.]
MRITGQIMTETTTALAYANVVLLDMEGAKFISGTTSDEEGRFTLNGPEDKELLLKITSIGYQTTTVNVHTTGQNILDVGTITVKTALENLDEVTVTSQRPTITMKADKMVISIEGTAMAEGATAFEVLEKSPGIFVDQDGNIQLNGQGGIRVLIDDRPVFISGAELRSKLESMSASEIKNIEIISNPSSKYDAAGTGGIVNIKSKKNNIRGTNGNISTGYAFNGYSAYNAQVNLNFKKNRWNSFTNIGFQRKYRPREQEVYREFNTDQEATIFNQTGEQDHIRFLPNLSFGTTFEIDKKQSISASINTSGSLSDFNFDTETYITSDLNDDVYTESKNLNESKLLNVSSNINYTLEIDTLGQKLTTDFNYVKVKDRNENFFTNRYFDPPGFTLVLEENLESQNPVNYDIFSGQMDYETPALKKGKIETGIKFSHVTSDNEILFYERINGQNQIDGNRTNHFVFNENIFAAYINYSSRMGRKTSYNIGVRAEQTLNKGRSLTLGTSRKRNYVNLFPSVFIQHNFSKNYQANLNYSRRIDRPRYTDLNPFIFYLDPFTWTTGNTSLTPQFTHVIKLTQIVKRRYYLLLTYSHTKGFINSVPFQNNSDNTTTFIPSNIDDTELYYATLGIPFKISKWWTVNNNVTASNQDFSFVVDGNPIKNNVFSWQGRTSHTFFLPNDLKFELSANYRSKFAYGLITYQANWGMDLAIKKSYMKKRLNLTIGSFDVFRTRYVNNTSNINGNINDVKQYFGIQNIRFALSYSFSNGEKFKTKQQDRELDELKRTNKG